VAIEASPPICKQIPPHPRLTVMNCAVAAQDGEVDFHIAESSTSSGFERRPDVKYLETLRVPMRRLQSIVEELELQTIDLLKLDIEGAEIGVLNSLTDELLESISQITVEYHDFNGITPRDVVLQSLALLREKGFETFRMNRVGHQDVLCLNRRRVPVGIFERLWIRNVTRYAWGMRRTGRRLIGLSALR
jgi:FkbM family methyltransferase